MFRPIFPLIALVAVGIALTGTHGFAQAQKQQMRTQAQDQEQIYGSQLMTPEESEEYRARMRAATTQEERERIRQAS